jgi:hypothetical protein
VKKTEFERRAAEMKARNLARPRFRNLPPPRSIFDPPLATTAQVKVHIHDYLNSCRTARLKLARRLLIAAAEPPEPRAPIASQTWTCPRCGGPMTIGPRLNAEDLAIRCGFFDSS